MSKTDKLNNWVMGQVVFGKWSLPFTVKDAAMQCGTSVALANRVLSNYADKGAISRVRTVWRNNFKDYYTWQGNEEYLIDLLTEFSEKTCLEYQSGGNWYPLQGLYLEMQS